MKWLLSHEMVTITWNPFGGRIYSLHVGGAAVPARFVPGRHSFALSLVKLQIKNTNKNPYFILHEANGSNLLPSFSNQWTVLIHQPNAQHLYIINTMNFVGEVKLSSLILKIHGMYTFNIRSVSKFAYFKVPKCI